jgi:Ca2+-binding EF-hand superfamily protein
MTEDLVPNLGDHGAQEFFHQWFNGVLHSDGSVNWLDFLDYYLDVSAYFTSEQEFCDFVCKSWGVDMNDVLAKRLFDSFATSDLDDVLLLHEFTAMIQEIDSTITDTEANAWYRDINERGNEAMTLQEFLSSRVLLVIRLFNEFGEGQRKLSYKQMGLLLRTLNSKMAEDEIAVVCAYADLDDTGIISLDMFLKQHLLTVLKIFDDFNVNGDRLMTEVQLKALLHKMDPNLGDRDITNVYKAIDVDGSGEIDFTEFLQSQVMRAKSLFDHYDTDKRKSLTHFKFRELLLDIDDSLDQTELEALYNLAADPVLDRVTLAGFLSPNIVKLKRLFDKYDKDRSKLLDVSEYRDMLKELFSDMQDDDVEILLETALPEGGDQEISLVAYIENYKAIANKHDTLTLSRFLKAKKKAKRRGLPFDPKNPFPASPQKGAIGNGMVGE